MPAATTIDPDATLAELAKSQSVKTVPIVPTISEIAKSVPRLSRDTDQRIGALEVVDWSPSTIPVREQMVGIIHDSLQIFAKPAGFRQVDAAVMSFADTQRIVHPFAPASTVAAAALDFSTESTTTNGLAAMKAAVAMLQERKPLAHALDLLIWSDGGWHVDSPAEKTELQRLGETLKGMSVRVYGVYLKGNEPGTDLRDFCRAAGDGTDSNYSEDPSMDKIREKFLTYSRRIAG